MTLKKLEKLRYLKKNIADLQEKIETVSPIQAIDPSVLCSVGVRSDPTSKLAVKLDEWKRVLRRRMKRYIDLLLEFEQFVDTIEDEETIFILRKRFVDGEDLVTISEQVYLHRNTVSRKISRAVQVAHKSALKRDIM